MNRESRERNSFIHRLEDLFEVPMIILGFVWLALLIIELVQGETPGLQRLGLFIWGVFILDFVLKLIIAPSKRKFLRSNVLTLISLVVPAFRVLRVFRIIRLLRFSRGLRLVKVLGSLNRGMKALAATMKRRAFGYILLLTLIVVAAGAAGMLAFEKDVPNGLSDYGTALWWTTMIITTLGSEYWPQTLEGRILCVVLSLYAFAVFGYITATIATFFIGRDTNASEDPTKRELLALREEIRALRQELRRGNHS